MLEQMKALESIVAALLAQETTPTRERIRELIAQTRSIPIVSEVDDDSAERLARRFEERLGVVMTIGAILTNRDHEPWLGSARAGIDPYYWDRYKKLLIDKGLPSPVLTTIDDVTERILARLEDPAKQGAWDRRGLVVGHVQSGKTANYIGLICKAADAGYKLIVIIAGIHNNLRNQTQQRIDEGFVGRDSARLLSRKGDRFVGVGRFDQTRRPVTFTNSVRDFNKTMATGVGIPLDNLNEPAVFVIKKNSSTLRNLLDWLREHSARAGTKTIDTPMLVIDDEADNASINISHGKGEVSRINGQIRELLRLFDRSCYIGYTATPFANIFIDPDSDDGMRGEDLFPRSFLVSLDSPSNYFGANRVFLDEPDTFVRDIEDNEDLLPIKHKKDFELVGLPPSLIKALRAFVITRAIRLSRGHDTQHCSMLVNASRFVDVQRQLHGELRRRLGDIQASVRVNSALEPESALRDPEISALRSVWQEEFIDAESSWPVVQEKLHSAVAAITVVEVNSRSPGTLNYADHEREGLNVIAIGGFSLSRGLTLEGLTTSYFLRNSMMYDTLMQLCRWFGYKPEFDDLCRIWMPEEARDWYAHIAESIDMLRDEMRSMEAAGATPEEFGLKVRSHPDNLIVTARNKMGSGENIVVNIGLGNHFLETAILNRDEGSLEVNREAARGLAHMLSETGHPLSEAEAVPGGWLVSGAPVEPVLEFLFKFVNHTGSMITQGGPVRRYIEDRRHTELAYWDVLFASIGRPDSNTLMDKSLGITINCQKRTAGKKSDSRTLRVTNKQRVASRGVEKTGLAESEIEAQEAEYRRTLDIEGRSPIDSQPFNYPDKIYRKVRSRPLLIIHLLKIDPERGGKEYNRPVVAWSISFPTTEREDDRVEYVVNTTWLRENYPDELDEEEMSGDDD